MGPTYHQAPASIVHAAMCHQPLPHLPYIALPMAMPHAPSHVIPAFHAVHTYVSKPHLTHPCPSTHSPYTPSLVPLAYTASPLVHALQEGKCNKEKVSMTYILGAASVPPTGCPPPYATTNMPMVRAGCCPPLLTLTNPCF